jgi:CRISPR-associated protein Csm5
MTMFDVTLSTLTPLHIGTGEVMRQDLDFVYRRGTGKIFVFDPSRVLELGFDRFLAPGIPSVTPAQLLTDAHYADDQWFRYQLDGIPRSGQVAAEIRAHIKDPFDAVYIPGSSLKGALRTALAWVAWRDAGRTWSPSELGRQAAWAGQNIERGLFGRDPNHDLLRALKVSDLHGPKPRGDGLRLVHAEARTMRGNGVPIEIEAVRSDVVFRGQLRLDDYLLSPAASKRLDFANNTGWLRDLPARVNAHSRARLTELADFFEQTDWGASIAAFYRKVLGLAPRPNTMLLQLGWGGGWDSKTFGSHLRQQARDLEYLIREYRLQRRSASASPRRAGDRFPASRRVAVSLKDGVSLPAAPLGWCLLEVHERKAV